MVYWFQSFREAKLKKLIKDIQLIPKSYKILSFFLIMAVFSHLLLSQEGRGQARLKGVVVDKEGNPVEGVKVELESLIHDLAMTTKTNKKGKWAFIGLGRTIVKIKASKEGYDQNTIPELKVSAIKNPELKIVLKKTVDIETLEQEDPRSLYLKGKKLYNQGEYEKSLAVFREFVATQPELFEARIYIGNCYAKLKQQDKALEEFNFVLEKLEGKQEDLKGNKMALSLYASLAELYMDKNDFEKAKEYFEKSIEIAPVDPTHAYNAAEILFNSNKVNEAIKYYEISTEIEPEWHKPYMKLGYCYINKGEMGKAIEYLEKFIELAPEDDPEKSVAQSLIEQLKKTK
jgi:tetratricopeptide (TPR) repeat protein